jgi:hypothetical protein
LVKEKIRGTLVAHLPTKNLSTSQRLKNTAFDGELCLDCAVAFFSVMQHSVLYKKNTISA